MATIKEEVIAAIKETSMENIASVNDTDTLGTFGFGDMDITELVMTLENTFNSEFPDRLSAKFTPSTTVAQVVDMMTNDILHA